MRVGVFGGTFDPPHHGHLAVALGTAWELGLDHVRWVVAGDPWQKTGADAVRAITSAAVRWEMVQAAVHDLPGQLACDLELRRPGPSYMIDTLRELGAGSDPADEFVLLLGADAASGLPGWHEAAALAQLVRVGVLTRQNVDAADVSDVLGPAWSVQPVRAAELDISSTDIRCRVQENRPIEALVSPGVCSLIGLHGLYGVDG